MSYELDEDDIAQYTYDANEFVEYTYDTKGNITQKKKYSLNSDLTRGTLQDTKTYTYGDTNWGDKLTSYNGTTITYDNIGNPLSYRDGMTMSWTGRELQSISQNNNTYSFTYNLNGLRTKKSVNGTNTFYYYVDSNNLIGLKKGNVTALFYYDSDNSVQSMKVGDNTYFFVKNLQGDIDKIIDSSGNVVATYLYFADGFVYDTTENSSIAGLNPFRYRGYVYDTETDLYYLQSRYYDSFTCRFLNADAPEYTDTYSGSPLSTNMFAYCENNPVMK